MKRTHSHLINYIVTAFVALMLTACGDGGSSTSTSQANTGAFIDSPVSGIKYQTETMSGTTNASGEFSYRDGECVTFSIGDIILPSVAAASMITPLDIINTQDINDISVVNMARLLQSLDEDGDPTNGISISDNAHLSATGMSLDFASLTFDADVVNLVANSGSVTTTLVDTTSALSHLQDTLPGAQSDADVNLFGLIYYVAPSGDDANDGSKDLPFKSVEKALTVVAPGDIIYLREGTHELTSPGPVGLRIQGVDGEPDNPIKLWAYPGERPVFVPADPQVTNVGILFSASYWHIRGLEVTGVEQRLNDDGSATFVIGFQAMDSTGSIFEALESHHNGGIGFYLGGNSTDNLVLNSDFHHNADPYTVGYAYGHADGMHIRVEFPGTINQVRGCRSWNNSDDGYDTWFTSGVVIFEQSWAFWNGYEEGTSTERGDGNGFKLGPYTDYGTAPDLTTPLRIVTRSIAFQNLARGFDRNGGSMLMYLFNNSSFENSHGYLFNDPVKYVIKNSLSLYDGSNAIDPAVEESNNSWSTGFSVGPGDFISVDPAGMSGARGPDGSLPATDFLKLAPESALIDAGVDVGYHYTGSTPDIGGRESGS